MVQIKCFRCVITLSVMVLAISVSPVINGQITTACTAQMITSFTPCMNFITGSTGNGTSPTKDCCGALKSLLSTGMDCACLIVTGNVPFQLPINQPLAISLPRACNMGGLQVQCKASGSPLPAPGPVSFGQGPSPSALSPNGPSPTGPTASPVTESAPAPAPETDTTSAISPASPPITDTPTSIAERRPVLTPSSAASKISDHISSAASLILVPGLMFFKL